MADHNIFPQIHLFAPVGAVVDFFGRLSMLPSSVDLSLSEHRGGAVMLDQGLYDQANSVIN